METKQQRTVRVSLKRFAITIYLLVALILLTNIANFLVTTHFAKQRGFDNGLSYAIRCIEGGR